MSEPELRKKIMSVMSEKEVVKVCTYAELKAVFGVQAVSNTQFDRALGSLCVNQGLHVYHVDTHAMGAGTDYRPCVVSLYKFDDTLRADAERELYGRYFSADSHAHRHLALA